MANLNEYLDELSLIKVLSFFILVVLAMTLCGIVFNIEYGDLIFKLVLYGILLVFFIFKLNQVKLESGESFLSSLSQSSKTLFLKNSFFDILFIIVANIFFVAFIFFLLGYMNGIGILSFDSYLFGNLGTLNLATLIIYFISVVILSPIVEEILFRGIFLRQFNKEFDNATLAILVSSLLFALCHSFGGISGAFLFGICMSVLYIKSDNLMVAIFAHFLNNLISFVLGLIGIEFLIYGSSIFIALIIILAILFNAYLFKSIIEEWPQRMQ